MNFLPEDQDLHQDLPQHIDPVDADLDSVLHHDDFEPVAHLDSHIELFAPAELTPIVTDEHTHLSDTDPLTDHHADLETDHHTDSVTDHHLDSVTDHHVSPHAAPATDHHKPEPIHHPADIPQPSTVDADPSVADADHVDDADHISFPPFEHFDPDHPTGSIIGTPATDMTHWHQQMYSDTCAISCEGFALNVLTHHEHHESDLTRESIAHGWYTPTEGTAPLQIGNLLEQHGVPVQRSFGCSLDDVAGRLQHHQKVIVGIRSEAMSDTPDDALLGECLGIPSQFAHHAVEVIGIRNSGTDHAEVIINDPGRPDGCGLLIPADTFEAAWAPSGHFMAATAQDAEQADDSMTKA